MYPLTKSTNFVRDELAQLAVNPLVFKNIKGSLRGVTLHTADITDAKGAAHVGVIDMNFLDPQCAAFWVEKNVSFSSPTVVLWGRESGRAGGAHANHDHSYTGMSQIVQRCAAQPYQVIVAGDYRPTNPRWGIRRVFVRGASSRSSRRRRSSVEFSGRSMCRRSADPGSRASLTH